jgi:hypothetical protein
MKKQKLYIYLGIALIVVPFLGVYQFIKDGFFILLGIIILLSKIDFSKKKVAEEKQREATTVRKPRVVTSKIKEDVQETTI